MPAVDTSPAMWEHVALHLDGFVLDESTLVNSHILPYVRMIAGQKLSVREIELLAHGYFRGTASLREAIDQGNWKWSLQQMQTVPEDPAGCNDFERTLLRAITGSPARAAMR